MDRHKPMLQKAVEVWNRFSELDGDGDGHLEMEEVGLVRPYRNSGMSTMAPYFLQRVWEVHVNSLSPVHRQPAMSLTEFVDFLLAWDHRGEPAACRHAPSATSRLAPTHTCASQELYIMCPCRYFFKALDVEHRGKLSGPVISMWCGEVFKHDETLGHELACDGQEPDHVRNELYDFVKPKSGKFITADDLCKCEAFGDMPHYLDVCGVLCDTTCMRDHQNGDEHQDE